MRGRFLRESCHHAYYNTPKERGGGGVKLNTQNSTILKPRSRSWRPHLFMIIDHICMKVPSACSSALVKLPTTGGASSLQKRPQFVILDQKGSSNRPAGEQREKEHALERGLHHNKLHGTYTPPSRTF